MLRRSHRIINSSQHKFPSINLFWITIALILVGVFAIFSATVPLSIRLFDQEFYFAKRHIISAVSAIVAMIIFSKVPSEFWRKNTKFILGITLVLLLMVFVPGIGVKVLGASRWLNFGFVSIQPSEIAKFAIVIYFAALSIKKNELAPYVLPMGLTCFLIMLEPDLGTTLTVAGISITMMYIIGLDFKRISLILIGIIIFGIVLIMTSSYRRDRLMTYLGLDNDTLGNSYHINQVLYALGSGGVFGVGIGQSKQKHLYLPETATDSIFPIIAEEFGYLGAMLLLILLFLYIYRLFVISLSVDDRFLSFFTGGLASWVAIQCILNLGSMVALLPLTGIPLPFISYGGTALVTLGAATGIALRAEIMIKNKYS